MCSCLLLVLSLVAATDHAAPFANYVTAAEMYESTGVVRKPVSGKGSSYSAVKPFVSFLEQWFTAHPDVQSMVEASCGHWPTGWQKHVEWPTRLNYTGVDVLSKMVSVNNAMLLRRRGGDTSATGKTGVGRFTDARFTVGNMINDPLPPADLLLTKDTVIHFSNSAIASFIKNSVTPCPRRFKYIMFVHDTATPARAEDGSTHGPPSCIAYNESGRARCRWHNNEDVHLGGFHTINMAEPPFSLPVKTVFRWSRGRARERIVQLLAPACP